MTGLHTIMVSWTLIWGSGQLDPLLFVSRTCDRREILTCLLCGTKINQKCSLKVENVEDGWKRGMRSGGEGVINFLCLYTGVYSSRLGG